MPVEPDGHYKQITARLWGKGLTLRGEVPGSAIAAARQYCAKAGQFLLSRIDARHGACGIVPEDLDGALVSNDFPCFDIDASRVILRIVGVETRNTLRRWAKVSERASASVTGSPSSSAEAG